MKANEERCRDIVEFIHRHRVLFYQNFHNGYQNKLMNEKEGINLVLIARKELEYSATTFRGDIYHSLFNSYMKYIKSQNEN